jgi:hypothetical protein
VKRAHSVRKQARQPRANPGANIPPWAKYVEWPSSAISVCQSDATARLLVPGLTGAREKPKPGNEGTMTSKERKPRSPLLVGSVSIGMILYISTNEPGPPVREHERS